MGPLALAPIDAGSPDPDRAAVVVEWRRGLRGRVGGSLRLGDERAAVAVSPLIELHNGPHADFPYTPNESWRGHVALDGALRLYHSKTVQWRLGVRLAHESDHDSSRIGARQAYLHLETVGLRSSTGGAWWGVRWELGSSGFAALYSCTRLVPESCSALPKSHSVGGSLELRVTPALPPARGFTPFLAVFASALAPSGSLVAERRAVAHVGVSLPSIKVELFGAAWLGNEVGIERGSAVSVWGLGAGWASW